LAFLWKAPPPQAQKKLLLPCTFRLLTERISQAVLQICLRSTMLKFVSLATSMMMAETISSRGQETGLDTVLLLQTASDLTRSGSFKLFPAAAGLTLNKREIL